MWHSVLLGGCRGLLGFFDLLSAFLGSGSFNCEDIDVETFNCNASAIIGQNHLCKSRGFCVDEATS